MRNTSFFIVLFLLFLNTVFSQNPFFYLDAVDGSYLTEGNSIAFRLQVFPATTTPVVASLTGYPNTASNTDFSIPNSTITIPAGQTTSPIFYINTTNDLVAEPNEEFSIKAIVTSGNTFNSSYIAGVTIVDDDTYPTLEVEGLIRKFEHTSEQISITYRLSNPYNSDISFNCVTVNGTTTSSDYNPINTTLTIPAGQLTASLTLTTIDDTLVEPDEVFSLNASVTTGNTANALVSKEFTILDNDTQPNVFFDGFSSCVEGAQAVATARLNRYFSSDVVINFTTTTGTASAADFTSISDTKTIPAGTTSVSVSIPITNDTLDEPLETFNLIGTVTSGNTTNSSFSKEIQLYDDDGLPDLSVYFNDSAPAYEGDESFFWIQTSTPVEADTVLQLNTSFGSAGSTDFVSVNWTVTMPAGTYDIQIPVPILIDNLQEGAENFNFTVTNLSGTTLNTIASTIGQIEDNYNLLLRDDTVLPVYDVVTNFDILSNDLLHGLPLNYQEVALTLEPNSIGATLNAQGQLIIPVSVPMGFYQLSYTVCELATNSCSSASISVAVVSPLKASQSAAYFDLNGDGFTSVGDIIDITYTITNEGSQPLTNIAFTYVEGVTNYSGGPITLNPGASDSATFHAVRVINQDIINGGQILNFFHSYFDGIYNGILVRGESIGNYQPIVLNLSDGLKLNAFIDSDLNGIQNNLEINFPYGRYNCSTSNGTTHNIYTSEPYFLYESNASTTYDLAYTIPAPYNTYNTSSTLYSNVTVPSGSGITTKNFLVTTTPYQDLGTFLIQYCFPPRPGLIHKTEIVYRNYSNQLIPSGTVTFTKPSAVTITSTTQAGVSITPTGFTYNFNNLLPYETRYISVDMLVPSIPVVSLGDSLNSSTSITVPTGDIDTTNNSFSLNETVVGAYDPNDKMESHGGRILISSFTSNDYLTYTIRFENTGTASANFIKITDVLDDKLEPSSLRMVDASSNYVLDRVGPYLTWKFNEINLPPSIPETTIGKGYVTFQIKPKPGYAVGDIIPNFASIYFDTNPAIITNVFNTEFVSSLSNEAFVFDNFNYFPNPVKNNLSISNGLAIEKIKVTSVLGQVIITKEINAKHHEIDLSSLEKGVYFVTIMCQDSEKTIKILKE
jgi:uncharacterized repeat protein (TIGR01451 family)